MASNTQKSPVIVMKEKFGEKKSLVEALEKLTKDDLWVARTNKDKGLDHVSNAKLLRLHALFTTVKEKFGTRDGLITAILEAHQAHRRTTATARRSRSTPSRASSISTSRRPSASRRRRRRSPRPRPPRRRRRLR